jgi:phospholipase A-2-activating protein
VRIWRGKQCVQTIVHPAISVWTVAVCQQTGDIVTGASDKIVRVFSREPQRQADEVTLKQFDDAVKSSTIPQQSLGEINKTDLPGPEFLQQKSGTKEGQVQMIKESNGSVTAYQWSLAANTWVSVGTVVDAAGSANKVSYNGKDYDYVFDVDIEDGKPPLKLPYNANENPYEVARKFITVNELSMNYIDQVADFIVKNSQGTSIGNAPPAAPASDPWGTGARYRPGDGTNQAPQPPTTPKVLPQKQYLAITTGNHQMILKKIQEFNSKLLAEGRKDLALNDVNLKDLSATMTAMAAAASKSQTTVALRGPAVALGVRGATEWPSDLRLPWFDYLRLITAAAGAETVQQGSDGATLVARLATAGAFDRSVSSDNSVMLAVRVLANLFVSKPGRALAHAEFEQVLRLVEPLSAAAVAANKNLGIALATLYINYAVLLTSSAADDGGRGEGARPPADRPAADPDRALALLAALAELLRHATDAETVYRALVGAGTVLCLGRDFADVAREGLGIDEALARAAAVAGAEKRIASLTAEIGSILGS